jgi:hypothetical protein
VVGRLQTSAVSAAPTGYDVFSIGENERQEIAFGRLPWAIAKAIGTGPHRSFGRTRVRCLPWADVLCADTPPSPPHKKARKDLHHGRSGRLSWF